MPEIVIGLQCVAFMKNIPIATLCVNWFCDNIWFTWQFYCKVYETVGPILNIVIVFSSCICR